MEQDDHELLLPLVDEENICLPLPINVISKYWNIELSMAEAIESAKKYSGFNGSVLIEGIESAERHGLSCKIVHSSINELKKIADLFFKIYPEDIMKNWNNNINFFSNFNEYIADSLEELT